MTPTRIALVGVGKIARDQHLPSLAQSDRFELAALVDPGGAAGVEAKAPVFHDLDAALVALPDLQAVAICTPPAHRYAVARAALAAGKHVLLEKPPTATPSELAALERMAGKVGRVLFTAWHSQYNDAVTEAQARLAERRVTRLVVTWKEDVRHWHPGQEWVWQPGGFGVFDPGINALSILTRILPTPLFVQSAELSFPADRDTPIAAEIVFHDGDPDDASRSLTASFDWRQPGEATRTIWIETADGFKLSLGKSGRMLAIDGTVLVDQPKTEYQQIYRHFAELIASGRSHVDAAPFQLVADALLVGRSTRVEPFAW